MAGSPVTPIDRAVAPVRVHVLLATYNGSAFLPRQLDSVLAQQGVSVRVSIRDDGSSDGTAQLVADRVSADVRVGRVGGSSFLRGAAGNFLRLVLDAPVEPDEYVAFCDQDDLWDADKLARGAAGLRWSGADGYSAATRARWPDGRERVLAQTPRESLADYLFEGAGQGCTFVLSPGLFARLRAAAAALERQPLVVHYHDWLCYAVCRAAGLRWHFDAQPCMTYAQHGANDTGARASSSGLARRLRLVMNGWYAQQVQAVAGALVQAGIASDATHAWLAHSQHRRGLSAIGQRLWRLAFVLRHGRRRLSDRLVLALAVICGAL